VNASQRLNRPASPVIRLILTFKRGELAILLRDDHPGASQRKAPGADDESGRSLVLAEAPRARLGRYPLEGGGKVTWP
jgi:hypothetical protein